MKFWIRWKLESDGAFGKLKNYGILWLIVKILKKWYETSKNGWDLNSVLSRDWNNKLQKKKKAEKGEFLREEVDFF